MKDKILSILLMLMVSWSAIAQTTTLSGTVLDSHGQPVPGAAILEKGTTNGTVSDFDGNFSLKVNNGATAIVSFMGMKSKEITASGDVVLEDEATDLGEVVAVGYGNTVRRDLTGSVGSVSGTKLAQMPVASAGEALQGKVAGVQVTTVDGAPGADINIRVRGGTSVTGSNDPLFIVDGFQTDNINDIPPTDIQSIDVLKDASLTAIYGAKGGNGVVIVTTKGAQQGKIKVDLNTSHQVSWLANHVDVLDPYEFMVYNTEAVVQGNNRSNRQKWRRWWGVSYGPQNDLDLYKNIEGTDWEDEIMGSHPWSHTYNITISGGNEKLRSNVSMTHSDQSGIISGSGVVRTNLNAKINFEISKAVKLLINPRITYRRDTGAGADNVGKSGIVGVLKYHPVDGMRDYADLPDGYIDDEEERDFQITNPKNEIDQNFNKKHSYTLTNQASLEITPIEGLTYKSDIALFNTFSDQNQFYGWLSSNAYNDLPVLTTTTSRKNKMTWTNTLSWAKSFDYVHNVSALIGQEIQQEFGSSNKSTSRSFPQATTASKAIANAGLGTAYETTSSASTPVKTSSFFGQVSYNYDHKYLISATFRADGSSKFATGKQWGYFPAVSAAWVVNRESFLEDVEWLSNLKLRLAVGKSGNNNIKDDQFHYVFSPSSSNGVVFAESGDPDQKGGMYYTNKNSKYLPNADIKWETTLSRNIAIDFGFLDEKITFTPEFYWNTTDDLLLDANIPQTTGSELQVQNVGKTTNKGIEISINYNIIQTSDLRVDFNFNLGHNKNKVDKLNGTEKVISTYSSRWHSKDDYNNTSGGDYLVQEGEQVGLMYGYEYDGLYGFDDFPYDGVAMKWSNNTQDDPNMSSSAPYNTIFFTSGLQPGDIKFKDQNGDGVIDANDRVVIGNTTPKVQGGFGVSGSYKWFDFTANFNYMLGFDVYNANAYDLSMGSVSVTNPTNVLAKFGGDSRWRYMNDNCDDMSNGTYATPLKDEYIALNKDRSLWNPIRLTKKTMNSYFVENGSFLRLQDITVGYTFEKALTEKFHCTKARVYATCSNLFCATKYSGYDPEVDVQSGLTPSMDSNRYPRSRGFLLGVNLSF